LKTKSFTKWSDLYDNMDTLKLIRLDLLHSQDDPNIAFPVMIYIRPLLQ
jgi:hypothetical protein